MRIAIQMDDPDGFNPATDSTIALALEAQARGYELWYYLPESLHASNGDVIAQPAYPITFHDDRFDEGKAETLSLSSMDVVLIRQDPPYDMRYLTTTYLLELLPPNVRVINHPVAIRNQPEKIAILHFPEFIPPTLISGQLETIQAFQAKHGTIVAKPLYGYGGRSVFKFAEGDSNLTAFVEQWQEQSGEALMVQAFLPEVASEDIRVIMMHGKVSAAVGRVPASGEIRANFRVGGTAKVVELNPSQQAICDTVGKHLMSHGVLFAGLDLIGDYLTEINITSPTGIKAAQALYHHDPATDFWDGIE